MKFINKLSVISLVVLMFSFMNVSYAAPPTKTPAACKGTKVSWCNEIKDQSQCANHFMVDGGTGLTCAWDKNNKYCADNGGACIPLLLPR